MKPTVQSGTGASPKKTPTSTPSKQPAAGAVEGAGDDNKEKKEEGAVSPAEGAKTEAAVAPETPGVSAVETARRSIAEGVAGVKASIGKVIPFKQNFGILRLPRLSSLLLSTLC